MIKKRLNKMKCNWEDLPERKNYFTVRSASMVNLNTKKVVRTYPANTKIAVTQKCVTPEGTFYRTGEAEYNYLNYAFKASAFGLPNEKAPSAPSSKNSFLGSFVRKKLTAARAQMPFKKQTSSQKPTSSKDGEKRGGHGAFGKIFRRKNGKAKNS